MVNYPVNPPLNGNVRLMVYKKSIEAKAEESSDR